MAYDGESLKVVGTRPIRPDGVDKVIGRANFGDLSYNCMARGKVLYDGHAVAAIAAISQAIAEEAAELIEVDYEVLPHVIDVEEAMKPNAPILHDDLFTQGVDPRPTAASNIAKRVTFAKADL